MSTQAAQKLGLPPGLNFRPDDDELVEFFLLPRARGQPAWFPGVVVFEDDTAANTLPWNLLKRHGLDDDDEAYFFVRTNEAKKAARQDRNCDGGGTWVSQRPVSGGACIGGEMIKWRKINLNLHMGRGKSGGGSTGWVMHEYTVTEPPCPSLKICRVSFSGHGKDRKRVPDNETDCQASSQPASKRARVDVAAKSNGPAVQETSHVAAGTTGQMYEMTISDQNPNKHASAYQQEYAPPFLIDQAGLSPGISNFMEAPACQPTQCCSSSWSPMSILRTDEDPQLQPVQSSTSTWGFPFAESAGAELCHDQEQGMPTIEQQHQPMMVQETSTTDDQQYGGGDQQEQMEFWRSMVQETGTMEQQYGGDQQEQMEFWRSIGVDTDNIVVF